MQGLKLFGSLSDVRFETLCITECVTVYTIHNHVQILVKPNPLKCLPGGFIYNLYLTVKCEWLVPLLAYKLSSCFSPFVFSFLPNQNVPPSTYWQRSSPTVDCILVNKPLITSCFLRALTMFCFLTWNAQSKIF